MRNPELSISKRRCVMIMCKDSAFYIKASIATDGFRLSEGREAGDACPQIPSDNHAH